MQEQKEEPAPVKTMASYLRNQKGGIPMTSSSDTRKTKTELSSIDVLVAAIPEVSDAPQVRLLDGRIVVDEESLVASRRAAPISREHVEETNMRITSSSFRRKKAQTKIQWSEEENKMFYEGLSVFGTDFGMISIHMKTKTRDQIRNKFKRDEKAQPARIRLALTNHKSLDDSLFKK